MEALFWLRSSWTWVRIHDPAANHTEQPMDLMFMNSIWASPVFPPRDAWLSGYPISYYYLGYWLLTTLGHLANVPPATAFTIGQASWYGLLLTGSFGVAYNLTALADADQTGPAADEADESARAGWMSGLAGLSAAVFVGVIGNLQGVLEWLYAQGARINSLAAWLDVNGFPENAQRSGLWYIGYDWWWWRSSRVIADRDLTGGHIEVIDEFPAFSYILGDNHPHVLAMPVALVVIGMALSVYLFARRSGMGEPADWRAAWRRMPGTVPMGWAGIALITVVSGGLIFLNTWDYPPYWLLLIGALMAGLVTTQRQTVDRTARTVRCVHCSVRDSVGCGGGCGLPALLCDGAESSARFLAESVQPDPAATGAADVRCVFAGADRLASVDVATDASFRQGGSDGSRRGVWPSRGVPRPECRVSSRYASRSGIAAADGASGRRHQSSRLHRAAMDPAAIYVCFVRRLAIRDDGAHMGDDRLMA